MLMKMLSKGELSKMQTLKQEAFVGDIAMFLFLIQKPQTLIQLLEVVVARNILNVSFWWKEKIPSLR